MSPLCIEIFRLSLQTLPTLSVGHDALSHAQYPHYGGTTFILVWLAMFGLSIQTHLVEPFSRGIVHTCSY